MNSRASNFATDNKRQRHLVRMTPAAFCAKRYINNPQCLPEDAQSRETWRKSPRKANVGLEVAAPSSRESYRKQLVLQVVTLRSVKFVAEHF